MAGFNPLQIITRIANNVVLGANIQNNNANNAQNTLNSGLNTGFGNFAQNMQPQNENNAPSFFKSTPLTLSLTSELKLTTIEVEQKANYVKDLLNLPKDFKELINQIVSQTTQSNNISQQMANELNQLLFGDKVNLSMLAELLKQNSKEAVQKLMMTIANVAKYGANDVSNLKELMNLFTSSTAFATETQALKTLMLLYLPWLPLSARNENNLDFTIDIFDKIDGPDPDTLESDESVKILMQTINFANVIATLTMNPLGQVDIDVVAGDDFPHKRVMQLIEEESSLNNVKSNISSGVSKKADANVSEYSSNVKITASGFVSPKLMLMAQSLIKIIINVDYEKSVIKNNAEGNDESKA